VVIDNDYAIWRAFSNSYWPALYLIDPRGRIRGAMSRRSPKGEGGHFFNCDVKFFVHHPAAAPGAIPTPRG
jgi:hypothetical protein